MVHCNMVLTTKKCLLQKSSFFGCKFKLIPIKGIPQEALNLLTSKVYNLIQVCFLETHSTINSLQKRCKAAPFLGANSVELLLLLERNFALFKLRPQNIVQYYIRFSTSRVPQCIELHERVTPSVNIFAVSSKFCQFCTEVLLQVMVVINYKFIQG